MCVCVCVCVCVCLYVGELIQRQTPSIWDKIELSGGIDSREEPREEEARMSDADW